jgi:pantoate--beta-alanine ligase
MTVTVVEDIASLRATVDAARRDGRSVGFVPTMGYLHAGHASLVRRAAATDGLVVVSVFVNPIQFGPGEDLAAYPRDMARDLDVVRDAAGATPTVLFHPSEAEMYPDGVPRTRVRVAQVSEPMCGVSRPVHFEGVATVVAKLFAIVDADRAYFGRKDAQQVAVVRQMAADLSFRTAVVPCPTVREPDGLAMSSRNVYLSPDDRAEAPVLAQALRAAADAAVAGERDAAVLRGVVEEIVARAPAFSLEYVDVRDGHDMSAVDVIGGRDGEVVVAAAARLGGTRLIDNVVLVVDGATVTVDAGEVVS